MTWTWTNVYLVCFLLGFSLSAASWLLTVLGLHLPHVHGAPHGHVHHGGAHHHGGHSLGAGAPGAKAAAAAAAAAAAPSPLNFSTLTAFLAWFGGAGYLLTRYSDV